MKPNKSLRVMTMLMCLLVFATSSCNPLKNASEDIARKSSFFKRAEDLNATVFAGPNANSDAIDLTESEWICSDIAGEISEMKNSSGANLKSAKADVKLVYDELDEILTINYVLKVETDDAEWNKLGKGTALVSPRGSFDTVIDVEVTQGYTFSEDSLSTSTEEEQFFGWINPSAQVDAFLCVRSDSYLLPDGLDDINTSEGFRNLCQPGYYYECRQP